MDRDRQERLLVEDALEPARYRVYPHTPFEEVVDLIVRRKLRSVPVVGESYEVLGIITSGDALGRLLQERRTEDASQQGDGPQLSARDLMTRAVLCVAEDQLLLEAARMMISRKVDQLPVVRDGELVGLLTRDGILHALRGAVAGGPADAHREDEDNKSEH